MNKNQIEFIYGDDWQRVTINGKVITENHSIRGNDLLLALRNSSVINGDVILRPANEGEFD